MLVLFESAGGFAIFKVLKEKKLKNVDTLYLDHEQESKAHKLLQLKFFEQYKDIEEAVKSAQSINEGKMGKRMKKCLREFFQNEADEELAVADPKLAKCIKDKFNVPCIANSTAIDQLMRVIRLHFNTFIEDLNQKDEDQMALGVAHGMSRYKFKFSIDKIDKFVISAVKALEDLDKELNNYVMRVKEWYGWHFPELAKLCSDNLTYVKFVLKVGCRDRAVEMDLSDLLDAEDEKKIKAMAEISMGCDMAEDDFRTMQSICEEVIELFNLRTNVNTYLKNRMTALAPNIVTLVGEMVGARLIAHAGSLINLAKHPASTVQILGAEKALFRALKSRHETPKYGMIYHAQMIGQSKPHYRGKVSRMLAAKTSLAARVDAFGDEDVEYDLGITARAKLDRQIKKLDENKHFQISGRGKAKARFDKYDNKSKVHQYKAGGDSSFNQPSGSGKRKYSESFDEASSAKRIKKEEK